MLIVLLCANPVYRLYLYRYFNHNHNQRVDTYVTSALLLLIFDQMMTNNMQLHAVYY